MVNVVGSRDNYNRWKPAGFENHLTMAELCQVVQRDRSRIKQLESEGVIPAPIRVKVGRLRVRLYAPDEVRKIAEWFKNAKPGPRRKP
jgi:hypothetical protein